MITFLLRPRSLLVWLTLALGLGLSACGTTENEPLSQMLGAIASQVSSVSQGENDARSQLSPAVVAAVQEPFLLVVLPKRQASATLAIFSATGERVDWRGADGSSIVTVDDIVIATRGLGADLFMAEAASLRAALSVRSGSIGRRHSLLDGENREITLRYDCTISIIGTETVDLIARDVVAEKLSESCRPLSMEATAFQNEYWIGVTDGLMWQSKQWISDEIGYLLVQHIKR